MSVKHNIEDKIGKAAKDEILLELIINPKVKTLNSIYSKTSLMLDIQIGVQVNMMLHETIIRALNQDNEI